MPVKLTPEQFIERARASHGDEYELPVETEFRDELPKTAVGKLSKKELVAEEKAKRETAKAAG